MKIKTKLAFYLTLAVITFSALVCTAYAADCGTGDYLIADFSTATAADLSDFRASSGSYKHSAHLTSSVARYGKSQSLEWKSPAKSGDIRIQFPSATDTKTPRNYDYIYAWIYSGSANGQQINVWIYDFTEKSLLTRVTADSGSYTGWKLWKIPTGLSDTTASDENVWYVQFQLEGFGVEDKGDTEFYVDSVWLSNTDYYAEKDELLTMDIPNGAVDVEPADVITFTAGKEFKTVKDYYNDKITVKKGGVDLTSGYKLYCEFDKIYVKFDEKLSSNTEYELLLADGTKLNDDTSIGGKIFSFTTSAPELEVGEYSFTNGTSAISSLPVSGTVEANVHVKNISSSSKNIVLILGVYDKTTNYMKKMGVSTVDSLTDGGEDDFEASVSVDSYENCYVRAFLWDSSDGMYSYGYSSEM